MKRLAVMRGGNTSEPNTYYTAFEPVITTLSTLQYPLRNIAVTSAGQLLVEGRVLSIERALAGVDAVFLLLPADCRTRDLIERYIAHTCLPSFGRRIVHTTLLNKSHHFSNTTLATAAREVHVLSIPSFRSQSWYSFPILEQTPEKPELYLMPDWLPQSAKENIRTKLSTILDHLPPDAPLIQSTFLVADHNVQLRDVSTAPELLLSPHTQAAIDSVGVRSDDFLRHIIESIA